MIAFLCIFLPALMAVWLYETLSHQRLDRRTWLYRYAAYVLAINFCIFVFKKVISHTAGLPLYELLTDMVPSTAINYLVLAIPGGMALVLVEVAIRRMFRFWLEPLANRDKPKKPVLTILMALLCILIFFLCFLAFFSARWYRQKYGNVGFDSILFTLLSDLNGLQSGLITSYLLHGLAPAVLLTALVSFWMLYKPKKKLMMSLCNKKTFPLFPLRKVLKVIVSVLLCVALIVTAAWQVDLINFLRYRSQRGTFFEDTYVEPGDVAIQFPQKKRNVIHIMLESMENTFFSTAEGGALEYNVIPELYQLAKENLNFSQNDGVGGFFPQAGSRYTSAAMVSLTSGTPFLPPVGVEALEYGADQYMPGLTTMMNILHDNGYEQMLLVGSYANYGGRENYFAQHGVDRVYDIEDARAAGIVPADYSAWWGMEDEHVYTYAKQELLKLAAGDKPFAFTMLTTDTHHIGGYICNRCQNQYEEQYENVYACASAQVYEFLQWIKAQDFYQDTLIVITGDHLSMDSGYLERNVDKDYDRLVYNCYINASAQTTHNKNRAFATIDIMPTTLAAMGCTIEGDRLGLGTNLFSGKPTLLEEMSRYDLDRKITQISDYYTREFYFE